MDCCQCQGFEMKYDQKYVAKKLKNYHKNGPTKTTRQLIEALQAKGVGGNTLLDIGGGIGEIQHALLRSGVSSATVRAASTLCLPGPGQAGGTSVRHLPRTAGRLAPSGDRPERGAGDGRAGESEPTLRFNLTAAGQVTNDIQT